MPRSGSTFSFNVARDVLRARGSVYQEAPPNISQELAQKRPTEITATQEAQFGTKIRTDVFIGNVKVVDPQFTLTSDRLTVHLNRDEDGGGLNDAEANGNVIIVHVNQPKTQGGQAPNPGAATPTVQPAAPVQTAAQQPVTSTGKAEKALYEAKDGSITLTGWPQVTQGANT